MLEVTGRDLKPLVIKKLTPVWTLVAVKFDARSDEVDAFRSDLKTGRKLELPIPDILFELFFGTYLRVKRICRRQYIEH